MSKDEKQGSSEDINMEFLHKVRQVVGNQQTYNEFLNILNQYSKQVIDSKTLIKRVEPFLGGSSELFKKFKIYIKYDDEKTICKYLKI